MKPILSVKVRRNVTVYDWTPASDHLTPAGLNAFRERMRERIARIQGVIHPSTVHELKRKP